MNMGGLRRSYFRMRKDCRRFSKWFFADRKYLAAKVRLAKTRAKRIDGQALPVIGCNPLINGCFLELLNLSNQIDISVMTVFSQEVVPANGGRVKVAFCEEPHEMLFSLFKAGYTWEPGSYLRVVRVIH